MENNRQAEKDSLDSPSKTRRVRSLIVGRDVVNDRPAARKDNLYTLFDITLRQPEQLMSQFTIPEVCSINHSNHTSYLQPIP